MTSLADDLLRTRTIPEIRELVVSLERDADGKKTELQHMVGSKYHDFIQSADKIATMREKSVALERQIKSFWEVNEKLVTQAKTILNFSQLAEKKKQLMPAQAYMPIHEVNCSKVWSELNDCNVFDATKLILVANILSKNPDCFDKTSDVLCDHYDAKSKKRLLDYSATLPADQRKHLRSIAFLSDTIVDDIHLLLMCSCDEEGREGSSGSHVDSSEVVLKAKALAALSVTCQPIAPDAPSSTDSTGAASVHEGVRRLLQTYLAAAEVRVQDILDCQLSMDMDGTDRERSLQLGIVAMVKLLQRIVVDVYLLFLSSIDSASVAGVTDCKHSSGSSASPVLGLVGLYQKVLLQDVTCQLQQYVTSVRVDDADSIHLSFDMAKALSELTMGQRCGDNTVGHSALLREQRKTLKAWMEGVLHSVTTRCKSVLSSLTSAAEVAQLQQQVWKACVNISDSSVDAITTVQPNASGVSVIASAVTLDGILSSQYLYNQRNWEQASASILAASSVQHYSSDSSHSNAHTYLWVNIFRECFLHQVERLLKCSCDEVLVRTKQNIFRMLRQQGVNVDGNSFKLSPSDSSVEIAEFNASVGNKRRFDVADYASDMSLMSSPRIYQMAERIRQLFEQDLSRLLADIVDPVAHTESTSTTPTSSTQELRGFSGSNLSGAAEGADPQSAGALAKALRTQCAQLIGHTLVLLRNLIEACQLALKAKGSLPSAGAPGGLYDCLRSDSSSPCVLTPDVLELVHRYSGCNFVGVGVPDSVNKSATSVDHRTLDKFDQSLLSSLLFIGRLAWLFKLRGNFLEYALQPRSANWRSDSVDASSSGVNLRGGAGSNSNANSFIGTVKTHRKTAMNNEDQFKSAFEIADTNGDGVVSYAEALEALHALSTESDIAAATAALSKPTTHNSSGGGAVGSNNNSNTTSPRSVSVNGVSALLGQAFSLSALLTPSLTYTEFALICGSTLLSADDCQPVSRLYRSLEQLIATAHITWAVCTVHILGQCLRAQYLHELGFSADPRLLKGTDTKTLGRGVTEKEKKKPFKLNWMSKWIDLDDGDGSSNGMNTQKEHVMIPGGICNPLLAFLHKVNQHATAGVVSIDTMQSCPVSAQPAHHRRTFTVSKFGHEGGMVGRKGKIPAIRDEFSDLLGEAEEVSDGDSGDDDANALFEPVGLLATLAGVGGDGPVSSVTLSHMALRVVTHISVAYLAHTSMAVLSAIRPANADTSVQMTVSPEALEEPAIQASFDVRVTGLLAEQWGLQEWHRNTASRSDDKVGIGACTARWQMYLDPITAELTTPLIDAAVLSHQSSVKLLFPHCQDVAPASSAASTSLHKNSNAATATAKTSEELLASVFPTSTHTASRFVLLPLAVSTAPMPVLSSNGRPLTTGSLAGANNGSARHSASSGNLQVSAPPTANSSTPAAKAKTGVMNWW